MLHAFALSRIPVGQRTGQIGDALTTAWPMRTVCCRSGRPIWEVFVERWTLCGVWRVTLACREAGHENDPVVVRWIGGAGRACTLRAGEAAPRPLYDGRRRRRLRPVQHLDWRVG